MQAHVASLHMRGYIAMRPAVNSSTVRQPPTRAEVQGLDVGLDRNVQAAYSNLLGLIWLVTVWLYLTGTFRTSRY